MQAFVVMPIGPGRVENVARALTSIERQTVRPIGLVLVHDGPESYEGQFRGLTLPTSAIITPKHEPGKEQPRNAGVREGLRIFPRADHVWFVDSDIIFEPDCLEHFAEGAEAAAEDRILIGPYDWLAPGQDVPDHELQNDPRWPSFHEHGPDYVSRGKLNDGLACFSGNLIWPLDEFQRVGGFWNDLHHGRCEDGELGLRAVAEDVPISFVSTARGWHVHHEVDLVEAQARNSRDVPMLNARHPWVQDGGLVVVDRDGKRFDQRCERCGELVNTIEYWHHREACG